MSLEQIKVDIDNLTTGMYVSRLDRPWINTPFPLQGYYIRTTEDISILRQYCHYVYIDIRRGKSPIDPEFLQTLDRPMPPEGTSSKVKRNVKAKRLLAKKGVYKQTSTPRQEVKNALKMKELAELAVSYIDVALKKNNSLPLQETRKVVAVMVKDIVKNPDAFIWLTKIKDKSSRLYGHTVRTAIWAVSLGRHMGVSLQALNNLALGIMLSEVGKTHLPQDILQKDKSQFGEEEKALYQSHVAKALTLLKASKNIDKQVLGIVSCLHERHDGSGYPRGLQGDKIPYLAKIAGISSFYDELTFPLHKDFGLSPSDAIATLYRMIDQTFQKDLIEEFIQAIGIYPAGTLVELSTGETAMVLEQNPERRLKPKVIILLDKDKIAYKKYKILDIMKYEGQEQQVDITYSLPMGSYGADAAAIYESTFSTRWPFSVAS